MNFTLTQAKAKQQAKQLAVYLKTISRKVAYGNALEAVAQMYGAKSWNHLSADLEQVPEPVAAVVPTDTSKLLYSSTAGGLAPMEAKVTANIHSDDRVFGTEFDAGRWFLNASDKEILELAMDGWAHDYAADAVALTSRAWDDNVDEVLTYVGSMNQARSLSGDSMGFEVWVDESMAMCFLRAFRYPLFVKLALEASFSDSTSLKQAGCSVAREEDGSWAYYNRHNRSPEFFETEDKAWAALGVELEQNDILDWANSFLAAAKDVVSNSGISIPDVQNQESNTPREPAPAAKVLGRFHKETGGVLVLRPGQGALSLYTLREITNDGEYYLQVAFITSINEMLDVGGDRFNDVADERVVSAGFLTDLDFKVYPTPDGIELSDAGSLYVLVTAGWDPVDSLEQLDD